MTLLKGSDLLLIATFQAALTPPNGGDSQMELNRPVVIGLGTKRVFLSGGNVSSPIGTTDFKGTHRKDDH